MNRQKWGCASFICRRLCVSLRLMTPAGILFLQRGVRRKNGVMTVAGSAESDDSADCNPKSTDAGLPSPYPRIESDSCQFFHDTYQIPNHHKNVRPENTGLCV